MTRVRADGKFFRSGDQRFTFRGVTYGTFAPRDDGERFPDRDRIKTDFEAIHDAGFTVVRTYTPPPDDLLEVAEDRGLSIFAGFFHPDWRYLVGSGRREQARTVREARSELRKATRRLAGIEHVAAISVGNEVPADVVRWVGTREVAQAISSFVEVVREEDPDVLVTYANYPSTEYLPLDDLDFLTFNVFLERQVDFRRYLTRLHHLADDRPLVLGEIGLDSAGTADGEERQAGLVDWQMEIALERGVAGTCLFSWTDEWHVGDSPVEGWHFGLTREDRTPKRALQVATEWNARSVEVLHEGEWPRLSVVICAYNAGATIDECLRHTCALDYPDLEVIVVDDGSTDGTAEITERHPRARLVRIEHAGLSVARNEGYAAATGEIVAYLDSDAYPTAEWPYYLVLGFDGPMVAGCGGPNIPPVDDPWSAQQVALAPGGPVHVLLADDRAEHVPGCNMAFHRRVLQEVGGCDPVYMAAGDDVDLCWKILDRGYEIGFHPAALVWHHRRPGLRPYLRQQRGYGRSEALVSARHPDRFTSTGSAGWRGRIYTPLAPTPLRPRVYHGLFGAAGYQSVYRTPGHALDLAHQVGVPAAAAALPTALLGVVAPAAALPAALAAVFLAVLFVVDVARSRPPRRIRANRTRFRLGVAMMHLLQPLVRTWGRMRSTVDARRDLPRRVDLPAPIERIGRVRLLPADRSRPDLVQGIIDDIRRLGFGVVPPSGWEPYDVRVRASRLVAADLVTTAFPEGCVQVTTRLRPRPVRAVAAVAATAVAATVALPVGAALAALVGIDVMRGCRRGTQGILSVFEEPARP